MKKLTDKEVMDLLSKLERVHKNLIQFNQRLSRK